jgi:uncharacterized protein YybS (DUF2232 family)
MAYTHDIDKSDDYFNTSYFILVMVVLHTSTLTGVRIFNLILFGLKIRDR